MSVLNQKTTKNKLVLGFLLVIGMFVSFGIVSQMQVHAVGNLTKMIYEHPLVVSNAALIAGLNMTKMHRGMKDVALSTSPDELDEASIKVNEHERLVFEQLDVIREMIIGDEGRDLEKRTRQLFIEWKPIREEVLRLVQSGRRYEAALITKGKGADHVARLESKMLELTAYARKKADNFMQIAEATQSKVENVAVLLVVAGVFLSTLIAFVTVRHVLAVEKALTQERNELQKALADLKTLSGLLPICASCKKIRDDNGYWNQIEAYIRDHSEAEFSHSICPECAEKLYSDLI
jgi:hypothetical protein